MKITSFLDFKNKTLESQVELAKKFNITDILLRYIDDKKILDLTDDDIVRVNGILRREKLIISAVDPLIQSYDLYNIEAYQANFSKYEDAILKAKALKSSNVILRLPVVSDIINEFETLDRQLKPIIELAHKNSINIIIEQGSTKTSVITYVLKYYKKRRITVIFNPKQLANNKESITASYRLLRKDIAFLVANDIDKKDNPALIGYGRLKILDLFKRFIRDKYNGYLILDDSFKMYFIDSPTKKESFFKRMFSNTAKQDAKQLLKLQNKILPDEDELVLSIEDIYFNQVDVLNIIFKIK